MLQVHERRENQLCVLAWRFKELPPGKNLPFALCARQDRRCAEASGTFDCNVSAQTDLDGRGYMFAFLKGRMNLCLTTSR